MEGGDAGLGEDVVAGGAAEPVIQPPGGAVGRLVGPDDHVALGAQGIGVVGHVFRGGGHAVQGQDPDVGLAVDAVEIRHDGVAHGVGVVLHGAHDGAHLVQPLKARQIRGVAAEEQLVEQPLAAGLVVTVQHVDGGIHAAKLAPVGDLAPVHGPQVIQGDVRHAAGTVDDEHQAVAAVELHIHGDALFLEVGLLLFRGGRQQGDVRHAVSDIQPGAVGGGAKWLAALHALLLAEELPQAGGDGLAGGGGIHHGEGAVGKEAGLHAGAGDLSACAAGQVHEIAVDAEAVVGLAPQLGGGLHAAGEQRMVALHVLGADTPAAVLHREKGGVAVQVVKIGVGGAGGVVVPQHQIAAAAYRQDGGAVEIKGQFHRRLLAGGRVDADHAGGGDAAAVHGRGPGAAVGPEAIGGVDEVIQVVVGGVGLFPQRLTGDGVHGAQPVDHGVGGLVVGAFAVDDGVAPGRQLISALGKGDGLDGFAVIIIAAVAVYHGEGPHQHAVLQGQNLAGAGAHGGGGHGAVFMEAQQAAAAEHHQRVTPAVDLAGGGVQQTDGLAAVRGLGVGTALLLGEVEVVRPGGDGGIGVLFLPAAACQQQQAQQGGSDTNGFFHILSSSEKWVSVSVPLRAHWPIPWQRNGKRAPAT